LESKTVPRTCKFVIIEHVTGPNAPNRDLGREIFRCRPKPLREFFALRYQGSLPPEGGRKSFLIFLFFGGAARRVFP
jgi:hypothetical protein